MRAILLAPVDLLWNGGIGTYVKARPRPTPRSATRPTTPSASTAASCAARCVGEGGNLGLTQRGRIEYAAARGGRINTDFIDNSAGVDTSDHEVNIKILLDRVVRRRRPDREAAQRPARLDDRRGRRPGARRQLRAEPSRWPTPRSRRPQLLHVHEDWIRRLERRGCSTASSRRCRAARRRRRGSTASEGLTAPELSVLLAYTKIVLADELLATDLADDPFLRSDLFSYFPTQDAADLPRRRWRRTRCAARSSSPRSSTTSSTAPA